MTQHYSPPTIGLDIGRSAVKVSYQHKGLRDNFIFPSNVCLAQTISHEETAKAAEEETVSIDGTRYFTGTTALQQGGDNTLVGMDDDWVGKPEYKALVAAALKKIATRGVEDIDQGYIIIGSPSVVYDKQREELEEITKTVINTHIKVLPQPSGAYFAHILNGKGVPLPGRAYGEDQQPLSWGVVEVGHYTTDFIMFRDGVVIEKSFDSSEGIGKSGDGALKHLLADRQIKTTDAARIRALVSGKIKHFGKEIDVSDLVKQAVAPIAQKILAKAESLFDRDAAELEGIILAGGGAVFIKDALKAKWPHVTMLFDARMAVAEGFLRYGLMTGHKYFGAKPEIQAA